MAANVDTMFFTGSRSKIWHGQGLSVEKALTSEEALKAAGLDWKVESRKVFNASGKAIEGKHENVRVGARRFDGYGRALTAADGAPRYWPESHLGVVSDKYTVVQNHEAFAFTDALIGGDVRYDTAGSLKSGKLVWLLAKMPERDILGDKVEPYLCFSNSHDGESSVRVCITPVRVVCQNTLNLAIDGAQRSWAARHIGSVGSILDVEEAQNTLCLANRYMDSLKDFAEKYSAETISDEQFYGLFEEIYSYKTAAVDKTSKKYQHMQYRWNFLLFCYNAPDIKNFRGTKWGALNAVSDAVYHCGPLRNTRDFEENRWANSMNGNAFIDKAVQVLNKI